MERSSAARTMGTVTRQVTLGDQTYLLSKPFRVRKAADEEAVIIARRLDLFPALVRACAALPAAEQAAWRRDYLNTMLCGFATPHEWTAYARSLWEMAFRFWHVLDPKHKRGADGQEMSLLDGVAWAFEVINDQSRTTEELDTLQMEISLVGQEVPLGESSGSAEAATPLTEGPVTVAGQP